MRSVKVALAETLSHLKQPSLPKPLPMPRPAAATAPPVAPAELDNLLHQLALQSSASALQGKESVTMRTPSVSSLAPCEAPEGIWLHAGRYCPGVPTSSGVGPLVGSGGMPLPEAEVLVRHAQARSLHTSAPMFRCPFCVTNYCLDRHGKERKSDVEVPWLTPEAVSSHLSRCHPTRGYTPADFKGFNMSVVNRLAERLMGPGPLSRASTVLDGPRSSPGSPPLPFSLLVFVDVANIEMSVGYNVTDLLNVVGLGSLLSTTPVAFCAIHETFVPHTVRVAATLYQLSQLHPNSDLFTFYAVSRLEAGDLLGASVLSSIRRRVPSHRCPPTVLLTTDNQQKACMREIFGASSGGVGGDSLYTLGQGFSGSRLVLTLRQALAAQTHA